MNSLTFYDEYKICLTNFPREELIFFDHIIPICPYGDGSCGHGDGNGDSDWYPGKGKYRF